MGPGQLFGGLRVNASSLCLIVPGADESRSGHVGVRTVKSKLRIPAPTHRRRGRPRVLMCAELLLCTHVESMFGKIQKCVLVSSSEVDEVRF